MTKTVAIMRENPGYDWDSDVQVDSFPRHAELGLINADELMTPLKVLRIEFDYPLSNPVTFTFKKPNGFTRLDLFRAVYDGYTAIYAAEEADCGKTENIPGLLNRQLSEGPFGIWGHDLEDLAIEEIKIKDNGDVTLSIGS